MKIIYVHGIANKPVEPVLKCIWDMALFGEQRSDTAMAYWVNRHRYPIPVAEECPGEDFSYDRTFENESTRSALLTVPVVVPHNPEERLFQRLEARLLTEEVVNVDRYDPDAGRIMPLPSFLRRRITSAVTHAFIRDSYDFLCVDTERAKMVASISNQINREEDIIIIAHSQGSLVAYEALASGKITNPVKLLLTLGSPLGIEEIVDFFKLWRGKTTVPKNVERWINVADSEDIVTQNKRLSGIYDTDAFITDYLRVGLNGNVDSKHSITGYLACPEVQGAMAAWK